MFATAVMTKYLSDATWHFCRGFERKEPIDTLLTHFSDTCPCEVLEHGLAGFAPFVGTPFQGHDGVRRYFAIVAELITYEDVYFSVLVVDVESKRVSVKGTATFTWIATKQSWHETFTYMLDFDEEDKIVRYHIWGDTGALYLASKGCLGEITSQA